MRKQTKRILLTAGILPGGGIFDDPMPGGNAEALLLCAADAE